jgi:hypothetical protein
MLGNCAPRITQKDGPKAPVSCTLDSTLQQVISVVAANRTHRVRAQQPIFGFLAIGSSHTHTLTLTFGSCR